MHVRAKNMATAGLLVAFSVVMMILSSVIESSSLFFIAAASFCVGIAVREWGLRLGGVFLIASTILNFILAPNKLYCFTLLGMSVYIWIIEWLWRRIVGAKTWKRVRIKLWAGKYIVFNLMYVPVLFFTPHILFSGKMNGLSAIILLLFGQIALYIYDVAYRYFQEQLWGRARSRLLGE